MAIPPRTAEELFYISKGLYKIVNSIVGPACIIKLRREEFEIMNTLRRYDTALSHSIVVSGSRAEGLKFKSSDIDLMYIDRGTIVITASTHFIHNDVTAPTLLTLETQNVPRGFAILRCLKCDPKNSTILNSLVMKGSDVYVSSRLVREIFTLSNTSTSHGPCRSDHVCGYDTDYAFTLWCPIWPIQAECFIKRSLICGWPPHDLLEKICKDGCLFIPINSKQQTCSDMIDLEWRISFSLAEKKLVHSMNHCQFLCYGLAKLFLNDVIKKTSPLLEDLLCSYFMKTALFWEISEGPNNWAMKNYLSKFWNIFRRLMKWVSLGFCPNFFIPENNMFCGKIQGENKRMLLSVMNELYSEGYMSLLRCSSIHDQFSMLIRDPSFACSFSSEAETVSMVDIEEQRLKAISNFYIPDCSNGVKGILSNLSKLVSKTYGSNEMESARMLRVHHILHRYAEFIIYQNSVNNRRQYGQAKNALGIIRKIETLFCSQHILHAECMYVMGNYCKTIDILTSIKVRLNSKPFMYLWCYSKGILLAARHRNLPFEKLMNNSVVGIAFMDVLTSIPELKLECMAIAENQTGFGILPISSLVCINFILFLSYLNLDDHRGCHSVLEELRTIVYYDNGHHDPRWSKASSWEILGICQQRLGCRHLAYHSYINAFIDESNKFRQATLIRILSLISS